MASLIPAATLPNTPATTLFDTDYSDFFAQIRNVVSEQLTQLSQASVGRTATPTTGVGSALATGADAAAAAARTGTTTGDLLDTTTGLATDYTITPGEETDSALFCRMFKQLETNIMLHINKMLAQLAPQIKAHLLAAGNAHRLATCTIAATDTTGIHATTAATITTEPLLAHQIPLLAHELAILMHIHLTTTIMHHDSTTVLSTTFPTHCFDEWIWASDLTKQNPVDRGPTIPEISAL